MKPGRLRIKGHNPRKKKKKLIFGDSRKRKRSGGKVKILGSYYKITYIDITQKGSKR